MGILIATYMCGWPRQDLGALAGGLLQRTAWTDVDAAGPTPRRPPSWPGHMAADAAEIPAHYPTGARAAGPLRPGRRRVRVRDAPIGANRGLRDVFELKRGHQIRCASLLFRFFFWWLHRACSGPMPKAVEVVLAEVHDWPARMRYGSANGPPPPPRRSGLRRTELSGAALSRRSSPFAGPGGQRAAEIPTASPA